MPTRREPDPFLDTFTGLIAARAVTTAAILGVFEALHERPSDAAELADRLGLDPLGAETLLATLSTLGYVENGGDGRARNAQVTERLLVRSSPESIATFVGPQGDLHWQVLDLLPDAVRSGRRYAMYEERRGETDRWDAYIRGLFEISRPEHDANAALVPIGDPRRLVAEEGYADRVTFREGDVFELGLGEWLDVVSVFNLVHHLPEERDRELCRMAHEALRPGGVLVIGDSARPEPGEPVSEHGAISSLLFYAWSHSRNFAPSEIRGWLLDAGFADVELHRNERSPWRVVVVGRRK